MLTHWQKEKLFHSLSSFYQDHSPDENQLLELYDMYSKMIDYVWEQFRIANDSKSFRTIDSLQKIPYAKLHLNDAMYDLAMSRRVARMSFDEQINFLNQEGFYTLLSFNETDNSGTPIVYSLRLFSDFAQKEELNIYEDFFLRGNKVYLLPNYIQNRKQLTYYLHAFDIQYHTYMMEKNFGTFFNLEMGPLLPRYEYRDVLEAFFRSFREGATIKSIRNNIALATKWRNFALQDAASYTISKRKKELYDDWVIAPTRFLLVLPETAIPDKVKINVVRLLLHEIKESQTDFMVFFDIIRNDDTQIPMEQYPTIDYHRIEETKPEDTEDQETALLYFEDFPLDMAARYDSVFFYDQNLEYDRPETPEAFFIWHNETPIPRDVFAFTDDTGTGPIQFTIPDVRNSLGESYELHGSVDGDAYQLIETKPIPDLDLGYTLIFDHDARISDHVFYKVRTKVDEDTFSFMSLAIDVSDIDTQPYDFSFEEDDIMIDETALIDETMVIDEEQQLSHEDNLAFIEWLYLVQTDSYYKKKGWG